MIKSDFDLGFIEACREMRDIVSAAHQKTNDEDGHKVIDWIWGEVKKLEYEKHGRPAFDEITKITPKDP